MEFGLNKCKTLHVIRGKLEEIPHELQDGRIIEAMMKEETYKYLGMRQTIRVEQRQIKKELKQEFTKRVRTILKTSLNAKNGIKAINTYAATALVYSFGVINWSNTEIASIQRKCRVLMTKARTHHPKSSTERTMLPRCMGGRGLVDINNQRKQIINGLRSYFMERATNSPLHSAIWREYYDASNTTLPISTNNEKMDTWKSKPLHGRHPNEVNQDYVDIRASNYWITAGNLFPETEGFMFAIQDQVIPTRNYLKAIVRDTAGRSDSCRFGYNKNITSGCTCLAGTEYIERHNSVAKILHQQLAIKYSLITSTESVPYYNYQPQSVLESIEYRLYFDRTILTDQTISSNRPDIMLMDKRRRIVWLVDVAIPNNNNMRAKHHEKINKYSMLINPIKRQWNIDTVRTIPIIITSTGLVPKMLHEGLRELGMEEHLWQIMQKAVVIATTRIVRKFMGI